MKKIALHSIIPLITFISLLVVSGCKQPETNTPVDPPISEGSLTLVANYPLEVTEPSGLAFGPNNQTLLTVSDNSNQVYELGLDGKIIRTWDYQGNDLEGITYNPFNQTIAITEERERNVVIIDYDSGEILGDYHINIPMGSENSGLEGIAFNTNNRLYYILNEDNPGELILWTPEEGVMTETEFTFAEDYSGIFIESESARMWIVSDLSKALFACNYSGIPQIKFILPDSKFEGLVVDHKTQTLFMVNDASAQLSIYLINNYK